jgi:hypothetical protein
LDGVRDRELDRDVLLVLVIDGVDVGVLLAVMDLEEEMLLLLVTLLLAVNDALKVADFVREIDLVMDGVKEIVLVGDDVFDGETVRVPVDEAVIEMVLLTETLLVDDNETLLVRE